jgi:hypothetical protein
MVRVSPQDRVPGSEREERRGATAGRGTLSRLPPPTHRGGDVTV